MNNLTGLGSKVGPLHMSNTDTPNCWALSLLLPLDKVGMEISLTPTPLSDMSSMTNSIKENLAEQQGLLTVIGIENIEGLVVPKSRRWTPITYAHEKLQFTNEILRDQKHISHPKISH